MNQSQLPNINLMQAAHDAVPGHGHLRFRGIARCPTRNTNPTPKPLLLSQMGKLSAFQRLFVEMFPIHNPQLGQPLTGLPPNWVNP